MATPYRRPARTLDYGAIARQQIRTMPLRDRIETRRAQRREAGMAWHPTPVAELRRRQQRARVLGWLLVCLVIVAAALVAYWLAPWLSLIVP